MKSDVVLVLVLVSLIELWSVPQAGCVSIGLMSESMCACEECQAMCRRRPCWPTPFDAEKIIAAGMADRLMLDWWYDNAQDTTVYVLTPAISGRERGQSPAIPTGACTFLNQSGLCDLHDLGLKPTEGRESLCRDRTAPDLHEQVANSWNSNTAQSNVEAWEKEGLRGRRRIVGR